jgi:hypothetical protein
MEKEKKIIHLQRQAEELTEMLANRDKDIMEKHTLFIETQREIEKKGDEIASLKTILERKDRHFKETMKKTVEKVTGYKRNLTSMRAGYLLVKKVLERTFDLFRELKKDTGSVILNLK